MRFLGFELATVFFTPIHKSRLGFASLPQAHSRQQPAGLFLL
jgi:hypothetical protein